MSPTEQEKIGLFIKKIREEKGLTYGVYSYMSGFTHTVDGSISIWGTFASQLFERGKEAMRLEIEKIIFEGVTDEEVKKHRALFDARTKVQMSNSMAFAKAAHDVAVDAKPLKYLDLFPKKILSLKSADVNKALKKYLLIDKISSAAAGPV